MSRSYDIERGERTGMELDELDAAVAEAIVLLREIVAINDEEPGAFRKRGGTRRGLSIVAAQKALALLGEGA